MIDMRSEIWKTIDGYRGRYQVNPLGQVRRVCKTKFVMLTPYRIRCGWCVKLSMDKKGRDHKVSHLVAAAFMKPPTGDKVLWHKNGMLLDNCIDNLEWIDKKELGKRTARLNSRCRTIAKIDLSGEVVEFYPSARAAAKENYVNRQSILDRCNGKVKNPFALDGYNYVFEA